MDFFQLIGVKVKWAVSACRNDCLGVGIVAFIVLVCLKVFVF